ncbi:thiamine pyrophosphate-dependent enzyme, partial [Kitasatospora phosalacinea]|uniref:thiamine pyrophosphate-dependent enzyme n=1 Tax=Kitasatospora phosalacinea TaxID=2065 RepID=UPI003662FBE8
GLTAAARRGRAPPPRAAPRSCALRPPPPPVRAPAAAAVERAAEGRGPGFLECRTYRFEGHHTMERLMKLRYRTPEEVADWRTLDPLPRAAALLPPGLAAQLDASVEQQLDAAREFAFSSEHPSPERALEHLYADGLRPRAGYRG